MVGRYEAKQAYGYGPMGTEMKLFRGIRVLTKKQ